MTVEMCEIGKAGVGAGVDVDVGGSSEDVSTQITEEVKLLIVELLRMRLYPTPYGRLVGRGVLVEVQRGCGLSQQCLERSNFRRAASAAVRRARDGSVD